MTQLAQSKEEQLKQFATAGEADLHPVQWGAVSTRPPRSSAGGEINIGLSWYFSTEEGREVGSEGLPFVASLGTMEDWLGEGLGPCRPIGAGCVH